MKRTIKLTAKDEDEKVEITIKLDAYYSEEWYPRDAVNKRFDEIVTNIVKKVLLEDYKFKDINAHKKT